MLEQIQSLADSARQDATKNVLLDAEVATDVELQVHDNNPTRFAASSWLDWAETLARLEADCYKGKHQKEQDEAYKTWFRTLQEKFERPADENNENLSSRAFEAASYLRTVDARASSFVEFIELLSGKKRHVRQKITEVDEGPTNEAVRQIQYGIWWRGLRHAARVMGFSSIVGGVPGVAISFWEPYITVLEEWLNLSVAPSMLAVISSIVFTTILSVFTGMWMYRSGKLARAARKEIYRRKRTHLLKDYRSAFAEACDEVDRALARLTKVPTGRINTFEKRWPIVEKRLAAEIDSCYFDEEENTQVIPADKKD